MGSETVRQLHKLLCHDLKPDLTILMVSDLASNIARARRRNTEKSKGSHTDENRFEKENRAFHKRVFEAFLAIADREPQRVVKVDATEQIVKVHKKIVRSVEERLFKLPSR